MGHGKESPRQKMIGMMYLVLTALLALNVSKDVLNAFVNVDEGLHKTTMNFVAKNQDVYNNLDKEAKLNENKAGKFRDLAQEVKKRADEVFEFIQTCKIEIINTADGQGNEAIKGSEVDLKHVNSKDNTDIPAQIMVVQGKAAELKKKIEEYRSFIVANIDEQNVELRNSIESGLNTENPPVGADGKMETWEAERFTHLPLAAVITIMSGLQADVRNAESDAVRYIYNQITAADFKFNKLEATVIPNSNYIISGNEYEAQIFLAASDSTQTPTIYIGDYEEKVDANGITSYKMRPGFDSIKVFKEGKGIFKERRSIGLRKWGGLIKLKAPSGGSDILKPFKMEYQVAEASLVVSPTKMNVFYIGVENPVEISVPGVPGDKIFPSISNGSITKSGKGYIVKVNSPGKTTINVTAEIEKIKKPMGSMEFRVKQVPDPIAKIGGIKIKGNISKQVLAAQSGVIAEMENFDFDIKFNVTEFKLSYTTPAGFVKEEISKSNKLTKSQISLIEAANKNQKIYVEDIKAVGPDGKPRPLGSIILTLN